MRRHLFATALIAGGLAAAAGSFLTIRQADDAVESPTAGATAPEPAPAAAPATPEVRTQTVTVRRGDTLVSVLNREGIDVKTSHDIATALRDNGANLRRVRARDEVEITWTLDGTPVAVRWEPTPWLGFSAVATEHGWEVHKAETRPDVRIETVSGEVQRSLFEAVDALDESPQLVIDLVQIFESEFDFTADTRQGDRFRVLVEKRYAGDQFVDYGRILAAQYMSAGRVLTGVGFEPRNGRHGYYDLEARSLQKTFLRAPLDFTRITSGFTYRRPHPILGGVRPHLAIDYAAPVGTPVRAVADGVVVRSGWNGGNGIQVVLKHRAGYETMYNHLSRAAVKAGARVRQRQVIGHVGSTGLSTGPHLDYRVSRNGRFVNPLSETFLPGEPLSAADRAEFERQARRLVRRLEEEAPFDAPVPAGARDAETGEKS
ncbi:MAG TPA: M23 family metallopeptidase [Candidatus Tectomicrobia bacterium]|nr:M23 family metallopeptidase [Candidatus Tectomicrobia bacterium]